MKLLSIPRCGVNDNTGFGIDRRSKRYTLIGAKWTLKDLTYRISKYSKALSRKAVDDVIARAFDVWSEYIDLTFTATSSDTVNIDIRFEEGFHGCPNSFDGPLGVLAHASLPMDTSFVHFDDAESWTIEYNLNGISLLQTAIHELGHSLGLDHSNVWGAVMIPVHDPRFDPRFPLDLDDIKVSSYFLQVFIVIIELLEPIRISIEQLPFIYKKKKQAIQALYGPKMRDARKELTDQSTNTLSTIFFGGQ